MCNAEEACRGLLRVYVVLFVCLLWLGRPRQPSRMMCLYAAGGLGVPDSLAQMLCWCDASGLGVPDSLAGVLCYMLCLVRCCLVR